MSQPILINGEWVSSEGAETFRAVNPKTETPFDDEYPISPWSEVERAAAAAGAAFRQVRNWPGARFGAFLDAYADAIEKRANDLVEMGAAETALPASPRLKDVELPRATGQMRQAAAAARDGSWSMPTIDSAANIRSKLGPLGPVVVFGPNNFPFAINAVAGQDVCAAVAAGNPVVAKAHSSHPGTTCIFAEAAHEAATATEMPPGFIQLIYRMAPADGFRLVEHAAIAAVGFTGSRNGGLKLKEAADRTGKVIHLELSSINPVFVLANALKERAAEIVDEFAGSCLLGTGQFCTNPGMVVLPAGEGGDNFVAEVVSRFESAGVGTMLSGGVRDHFNSQLKVIEQAGAARLCGGNVGGGEGVSHQNTLLRVSGPDFLANPIALQNEAFGPSSLFVLAESTAQMAEIADVLEGNLTGCIYSASDGSDDDAYQQIVPAVRSKVGRLLNDKMPTGVLVTSAMNHGGPYPAGWPPQFTGVGVPPSLRKFASLQCYDNVREARLPIELQNKNPTGSLPRFIDGEWTTADIG